MTKESIVKKIIIFFFLILMGNVCGQTRKIDSLKNELARHTKKDTTQVNLLNDLAFSYFSSDIEKSLEYLREADTIAEDIQFTKGEARSIFIKGITEAIQADYEQALSYYTKSLQLYEDIHFKKGVANCYNAMGITYRNKGEPRKSVSYFKKAIGIEEEIGSDNLSASLLNLGTSYEILGEYGEAISYLNKALSIAKADKNQQRVAYSLNNLGNIYRNQGNYPLALEHYTKSLYINESRGDSISMAHNLSNVGSIYKIQEDYDKAMENFERGLGIYERINSKQGVSTTLSSIGTIYDDIGDYKSALDLYLKALRIAKQIGADSEIPFMLNNIGGVYLEFEDYSTANQYFTEAKKISLESEIMETLCGAYIGLAKTDAHQKAYDSALSYILKAEKLSKKIGYLGYQEQASEILSSIYQATGNYKKALESHQQYKILNDSLFNKENIEKIAQLESEYKYKQALDSANIRELKLTKTVLTTSQDLAKSRQNYLWAVIGILVISILSGSLVFYQKYKTIKVTNQNIVTEQKLLRSQMTPHFIFNSLSVLQGIILNKEEKKSITYLSKFSKLLRIVLENSRDKVVPLIQELDAIDNYMILQNLDADPPYDYSLVVDENIDIDLFLVPPMLIQPFIENAIEHAFTADQEQREIEVHLSFKDKKLSCTITDNGIGIDTISKKANMNKRSLATTITGERLQMLAKDFHMPGNINIQDRKKYNERGTLVTLIIPYKMNKNS